MQYSRFTRDERNLLMYLETRLVDHQGLVNELQMNDEDRAIARRWNEEGFLQYGRVPAQFLGMRASSDRTARAKKTREFFSREGITWVRFSDQAWRFAARARQERSQAWIRQLGHTVSPALTKEATEWFKELS